MSDNMDDDFRMPSRKMPDSMNILKLNERIEQLEKTLRKIKNWYSTHRRDSFLPTSIIDEVNEVIE